MAQFFEHTLEPHFNFWIYVILMMIGLWAIIAKNNLIKKLIGMSIFQTAIILFYVSVGVKEGATIPIIDYGGSAYEEKTEVPGEVAPGPQAATEATEERYEATSPNPDSMVNPLPHVLMLTAIVVGVATLGVALAICQMIFKEFGTLEENEILEKLKADLPDD